MFADTDASSPPAPPLYHSKRRVFLEKLLRLPLLSCLRRCARSRVSCLFFSRSILSARIKKKNASRVLVTFSEYWRPAFYPAREHHAGPNARAFFFFLYFMQYRASFLRYVRPAVSTAKLRALSVLRRYLFSFRQVPRSQFSQLARFLPTIVAIPDFFGNPAV